MLAEKGVVVAGWSDGMSHAKADRMPGKVHSNNWGALAGEGPASAHLQANQGWEVVISTPEVMYFDSPQAADPKERGYDWPLARHRHPQGVRLHAREPAGPRRAVG